MQATKKIALSLISSANQAPLNDVVLLKYKKKKKNQLSTDK